MRDVRSVDVAVSESLLITLYTGDIIVSPVQSSEDKVAVQILQRMQPALLSTMSPRTVDGDGNCCYRALSLAMYGTQSWHRHVRVLTAAELLTHRAFYDVNATDYVGQLQPNELYLSDYDSLLNDVLIDGGYAELLHIYAASAALGEICYSFHCSLLAHVAHDA